MKKVTLSARDGYSLSIHVFEVKRARAMVQIIHGIEEHQERYESFVRVLNKQGFSVVSSDLRGHGRHCKDLGFFKEKGGYLELISDQQIITQYIKEHYVDLPIYIFAHSFGTIITRVLLQTDSMNYEKVILSGYPNYQRKTYLGILASSVIQMIHGAKYQSKLLSSLSLDVFNKSIRDPKTAYDWICRNEETVKKYMEDPYCGIGFTCSAFHDLYKLVILMHKVQLYKDVHQNMELLLLRGQEDPCTGFDKGSKDSYETLRKAGFHNIQSLVYPNMRHEVLGEKNHTIVYQDIFTFFLEDSK